MKVGFIGLGIMGESMCENIIKKSGDTVYAFDVMKEKVDLLASKGAVPCASAKELAKASDLIITMLPKPEHVHDVFESVLDVLDSSKICIDMSTIGPSTSVKIAEMVRTTGADFADVPVVKSKPAAVAGKLGIYMGGRQETFDKILPILQCMGENVIRVGDNGMGLVMKVCHNALVSQIQNGVNETLLLALKNGIPVSTFAKAISYGGGQNFYLDTKAAPIEKGDFTTNFSVVNMHKDVHICMDLAKECGLPMPGEANACRVYDKAMEMGLGGEDFCATFKVVKEGL